MRVEAKRRQSRLAIWSRRAALVSIPVLLLAIIGSRTGFLDVTLVLALLALGLAQAFSAVVAAVLAFGAIWRDARAGFAAAVLGLAVGAAVLAYPGVLFARLFQLPAIADVTTDPANVPAFLGIDWQHADPTPQQMAAQMAAYPEVVSHVYAADAAHVFEEVALLVGERGWDVMLEEPPVVAAPALPAVLAPADAAPASPPVAPAPAFGAPGLGDAATPAPPVSTPGYVTAVAWTPVVGFREDVAIRVMAGPEGAIVDMRSASRVFAHDFGSDARRIERFLADLDGRLPLVSRD